MLVFNIVFSPPQSANATHTIYIREGDRIVGDESIAVQVMDGVTFGRCVVIRDNLKAGALSSSLTITFRLAT